jgi:predicted aspartyl protease
MKCRTLLVLMIVLASLGLHPVIAAGPDAARIWVLSDTDAGLVVDAVKLEPGEQRVFQSDPSTGMIDVILPPSHGTSASLARLHEARRIVVRYVDGRLHVEAQGEDGRRHEYPSRSVEDLRGDDIRLSVTGNGRAAAFTISGYAQVSPDAGPVANMFAGKLPFELLDTDYVVQTETAARRRTGTRAAGSARLELEHWPFVEVASEGGKGVFLVDIGAAETVVDRAFLPEDVAIEPLSMVEYSAQGRRTLKYAPNGATGPVQTVVGRASIGTIRVGDIRFDDVSVTVLERMPEFFGRPVAGIIGLDLLGQAEIVSLEYGAAGGPVLRLSPSSGRSAVSESIELPYARVQGHLVVQAACNGLPMHLVLDTGAPVPLLDQSAADTAGVTQRPEERREASGLDEGVTEVMPGRIDRLTLGGAVVVDVPCMVGPLPVFDALSPASSASRSTSRRRSSALSRTNRKSSTQRHRGKTERNTEKSRGLAREESELLLDTNPLLLIRPLCPQCPLC